MASATQVTIGTTMDVVMAKRPEVIHVLIANRMHCVGCLLAPFHDVGDAAREHELDANELLKQLQQAAAQDED